jgi:hypothetical protein
MPRIRSIKPEFWTSKTIARLSRDSRLFFIGLWNYADDMGVLLDSDRKILGDLFPFDEDLTVKNIAAWKSELVKQNLIVCVSYNSKEFIIIRAWKEHQKIDNPSKKSWLSQETIESLSSGYRESPEKVTVGLGIGDWGMRNGEGGDIDRQSEDVQESPDNVLKQASSVYAPDFEDFWKAYPRKVGKGAAFKAWKKEDPDLADVLQALEWQIKQNQWVKDGGQFIPHPATWLNQRRWEDEAAPKPIEHGSLPGTHPIKDPGPMPWEIENEENLKREKARLAQKTP